MLVLSMFAYCKPTVNENTEEEGQEGQEQEGEGQGEEKPKPTEVNLDDLLAEYQTQDDVLKGVLSPDKLPAEIHDGDEVLVRHGASLRPGEIGVFTNGDAGYIKVYQRDGLHSLNPAYPTMFFGDGDEVRCIGKVLGIAGEELFARREEIYDL